jgi:heptaprenyl diphosphate synthase
MIVTDNMASIFHQIERAVDHPTLNRFIQVPYIDQDRVIMLYSMFNETGYIEHIDDYITSISLVQIALDTHDKIRLNQANTDRERKLRQLTVLAGDYYSSQYYQLLAKYGDFRMIRYLSEAIQKVNEYKTSFFKQEYKGLGHFFDLIKQIESTLLLNVAKFLDLPKLKHIIGDYFFVKRLITEKKDFIEGRLTLFFHSLLDQKPEIKEEFMQAVDEAIEAGVKRLLMNKDIFPFMNQLTNQKQVFPSLNGRAKLAEEGLR